jgi:hypothetical protein
MKREECVLCSGKVSEFHRISNMPSFMGVVESNNEVIKEDMVFGECEKCGMLQNLNLLNLDIVYLNNHNTEVVGRLWEDHYHHLTEFIKKNSHGEVILEIGDPSAKLAKPLKDFYKRWVIIEPNTELQSFDNIEVVKGFFKGENPTNYDIETIVHSHVFEHLYDPVDFLNNCNKILPENGVTIFSIPNIKWMFNNNSLPGSILHFEHTYYVNEDNISLFLNKCGFELGEIYHYKNHSLFIKAIKNKKINTKINFSKVNDKFKFMNLVKYYGNKIKKINNRLNGTEYYLYSAHINSQYLLNNGLNKNIKGLLDKSKSKIGKKLYGYDYDVLSPNILSKEKNPIVLCSHMGVYFEEIKDEILEINKNSIIL